MKHAAAVVLCILLLWVPARAADTLSDQKSAGQASMQNALDGEAQSLLSGLDGDGDLAPEETGLGECECRLNLIEKSEGFFPDGGHALEWAISRVK